MAAAAGQQQHTDRGVGGVAQVRRRGRLQLQRSTPTRGMAASATRPTPCSNATASVWQLLDCFCASAAGGAIVPGCTARRPALWRTQYRAAASASASSQPKGAGSADTAPRLSRIGASSRSSGSRSGSGGPGEGQVNQCELPFGRAPAWELLVVAWTPVLESNVVVAHLPPAVTWSFFMVDAAQADGAGWSDGMLGRC
jgi:hypothetical protein